MRLDRKEIEPFVRDTLGCGCPDEVFRDIDLVSHDDATGGPAFSRLLVGGRLLIYVAVASSARDLAQDVRGLATRGLAERNEAGYNRFRLVVVLPQDSAGAALASDAFAAAVGHDPRAHLHCIADGSVPAALVPVRA